MREWFLYWEGKIDWYLRLCLVIFGGKEIFEGFVIKDRIVNKMMLFKKRYLLKKGYSDIYWFKGLSYLLKWVKLIF